MRPLARPGGDVVGEWEVVEGESVREIPLGNRLEGF